MKWRGRQGSSNIEDQRGRRFSKSAGIGGIGTIIIALIIILLGGDPRDLLSLVQDDSSYANSSTQYIPTREEEEMAQFISVVLADTEDVWNDLFQEMGYEYREPKLVLFNNNVKSACGFASSATGPFYCPGDEKIYIDLEFLDQLQQKLKAEGDFAVAYIIAHEVGHHVQNLLGIIDETNQKKQQLSEKKANALNVKIELQADFLAGIWAHYAEKTKNILEEGDIEEAMNAAQAVGDDRIQMNSQGYVVPDSFTHGTSKDRMTWFLKGFRTGDLKLGQI
jgi:uncharacterized protein